MNTSQLSDYILSYRGTPVKALSFVPSSDEGYINVYAQYDSGWQPLHLGLRSIPSLQQVRDMNRNILLNKGSYEDAHFYLRSAEGNNVTTAFYTDADGGAIQSGDTDSYRALNLQPLGGLLTYGGNEVATRNWVNANNTLQAVTNAGNTTTKPIVLNTGIVDVNGTANSGNAIPAGLHVWDTSGLTNSGGISTMLVVKKNDTRTFEFGASSSGSFLGRALHTVTNNIWKRFWTDADFTSAQLTSFVNAGNWYNNSGAFYTTYGVANTDITSLVSGSNFGTWIKSQVSGHVVVTIDGNDDNDSFNILSNTSSISTSEPMTVNLFRLKRTGELSLKGTLSVGSSTSPQIFNAGATAFPSLSPITEFVTGSVSSGYREGIVIRHASSNSTAELRETGIFIKLGYPETTSSGESAKGGAITMSSANAHSGNPDMNFYILNSATPAMKILNSGIVRINNLSGTGYRPIIADGSGNLSSIPFSTIGDDVYLKKYITASGADMLGALPATANVYQGSLLETGTSNTNIPGGANNFTGFNLMANHNIYYRTIFGANTNGDLWYIRSNGGTDPSFNPTNWKQVADRSWVSGNAIMQGGNSLGTTMRIGTLDNNPIQFYVNSNTLASITSNGRVNATSFGEINNSNNGLLSFSTGNSMILTRDIADANPALYINNKNSSSTGNIVNFQYANGTKALIDKDGYGRFNRIGVNSTLSSPSYLLDIDGGTSTSTGSIARFTRNGGYVEIYNGSSTIGYPVIRGISSFNSAAGMVVGGAGSYDSYTMGAIVLRGYNAAINGGLTGGNVLSVQNYTTELFKIGYDGVATISNLSGTTGYVKADTNGTLTKVTTIPISDTTYSIPSLQQVATAGNSFTGDLLLGTTGNEIFVGSAAGTENTRLGKQTLASVSGDARWNTAIGSGALHSLTAGYNNTAVGEGAMYEWVGDAATLYSNNTAIGDIAMALATSGIGNVALGAATGSTGGILRSRGNYNTFLGTNAGRNAPAGTLGDLNLFIGYNAGAEGLLGSYLLRIGSKAPGATNAPHIIEGTMNPGIETLNLNATVYLRDLPASSGASHLVAWNAATQRLEKDSNTSGYIINQNASAQSGQFWIGGGAQIGLNPGTGSILSIGDTFTDGYPFVSKALNVTGNVGVAGNVNMNNLSLSDNYGSFTYKLNVGHGDGVHATSYAWIASLGIGGDIMRFAEYGGSFEFYSTAGFAGGGTVARINPYGIQVMQSYGKYMMSDSSYLYGNDSYWAFYNSANAALPIKAGGLVVSNNYANTAPVNGIFSKGSVLIWGNSGQTVYDNGNTGLVVSGSVSPATSMTLGSSVGTKFGVVGDTGLYGLFHGVSSVSGEAWIQSGRLDSSTAYNLNLQTSGGNVGIGLAAPTYKLDVKGTFRTSSTNVMSGLAGAGTRMVVALSNGTLSTQTIPSAGMQWMENAFPAPYATPDPSYLSNVYGIATGENGGGIATNYTQITASGGSYDVQVTDHVIGIYEDTPTAADIFLPDPVNFKNRILKFVIGLAKGSVWTFQSANVRTIDNTYYADINLATFPSFGERSWLEIEMIADEDTGEWVIISVR